MTGQKERKKERERSVRGGKRDPGCSPFSADTWAQQLEFTARPDSFTMEGDVYLARPPPMFSLVRCCITWYISYHLLANPSDDLRIPDVLHHRNRRLVASQHHFMFIKC